MNKLVTTGILGASLALLAAGCNPPVGLDESPTPSKNETKGYGEGKDPTGSTTGTTTGSTTGTSGTTGGTSTSAFNPNRENQTKDLQVANCTIGGKTFRLWVMDTNIKRGEGMMFLKNEDFKDDQGMVFVFKQADPQRFWMRNTLVDLDICYCNADGTINSTYTMKSMDEDTDYSSKAPSKYVIELRAGALAKHGIKTGMKWQIPSNVVAKE